MSAPEDKTVSLGSGPLSWSAETGDGVEPVDAETISKIGRFLILGRIGVGAMGQVFAAYDEELDRKVAIKLLRGDASARGRGTQRLLREAQALARISHPNVVQIYDVGPHEGGVFIAMEFIHGRSAAKWIAERQRPWREVLEVFMQAGQGLQAAHEAGIVHRDFKPDNVMIGADGRVRVLDFGVARYGDPLEGSGTELGASGTVPSSTPVRGLTEERMVGTPAYMAPEQLRRTDSDAASDQFSFCVTLFEALYGFRPFAASTVGELIARIERGPLPPPSEGVRVPGKVHRTLLRGLAHDPRERYPSMAALLAELHRHTKRVSPWIWGSLTLALVTSAAAAAWVTLDEGRRGACSKGQEQLAGAWDEARREALQAAFAGSSVAYAQDTLERLEPELDGYAERWASAYTAVCLAHKEGEISAELLDQRMACLRTRRGELRALVEVMTEGSAKAVENAAKAGGALVPVERCAVDNGALVRVPLPTQDQEEAVQSLRESLAAAKAEFDAGLYDRGLERATAAVTTARTLGYEPLLAEALHRQGALLDQKGQFAEAEAALFEAMALADANAYDELRAGIGPTLVFVVAVRQGRLEEGEHMARLAWAALRRSGENRKEEQRLLVIESYLLQAKGELEQARERLASALSLADEMALPWARITTLNQLGSVALSLERYDEARQHFEVALTLARSEFGPKHPQLVGINNNLATALSLQKRFDDAERALTEAREIAVASLGPKHPMVATVLDSLGLLSVQRKRFDEAIGQFEEGLAILESTLGNEHATVMPLLVDLLDAQIKRGTTGDARVAADRAVRLWEANGRATTVDGYFVQHLLRLVALMPGEEREGVRRYLDVCFTIARAMGERGAAWLSLSLAEQAVVELAEGRHERGKASLREAQAALKTATDVDASDLAKVHFRLARVLWDAREHEPALEQARAADELVRSAPEPDEQVKQEISAWLAAKPSGEPAP